MEQFYYFDIIWQNEDNQPERTRGFITARTMGAAVEKLDADYDLIHSMTIKEASEFRAITIEELTAFLETLLPENRLEEICGSQIQAAIEALRAVTEEE